MYRFFDYFGSEHFSSSSELLVFIAICCNKEYCSKSNSTLSYETRLSRSTVIRCIKSLANKNFITISYKNNCQRRIVPTIKKLEKEGSVTSTPPSSASVTMKQGSVTSTPELVSPRHPNINITLTEHRDGFEISENGMEKTLRVLKKPTLFDACFNKDVDLT